VPAALAARVASADGLFAALDIAEVAELTRHDVTDVGEVHVGVANRLALGRLRQQIDALPAASHWQSLAKNALGDDLAGLQRSITQEVLAAGEGGSAQRLAAWEAANADALERAQRVLVELADMKNPDLAMLSVALRELRNLA
jgi:glutamate dehydrogenase